MFTLGIDPGTQTTGYGIVEQREGGISAVQFGVIKTPLQKPLSERYAVIYDSLISIISDYSPDDVAIESSFFMKNVSSIMKLSQARGIVLLAAAKSGLSIYEYTPRRTKQAVTGRGGATKQQVQKMVQVLLGLDKLPSPIDASDALAVAICHVQCSNDQRQTGKRI